MSAVILVVDDTPANVRLLEAILGTHGYSVRSATSGPEALADVASDSPPDLVVLDIQMPGMNGYEVCRRIRDDASSTMLPVIMITASGGDEKLAALEAGADDFIPRPFDQAELLARVRSLIRIKTYHDTVVGQAAELTAWNRVLEEQVAEQVDEVQHLQRLRRFLSAHVADAVLRAGDDSLLQPHRREIAVVFCDLREYTAFAAAAEPEDVLATVQEYHAVVGDIVTRHGATVGGFAGDGVMLFFNDPFPCSDPALRAVQAADELRSSLAPCVQRWRQRGHHLDIGLGVGFGYATLGVIGFEGRYEYTAIGSVVNLAARLCDHAAPGEILLGQNAYSAIADRVAAEALGELSLRGLDSPVPVWRYTGFRSESRPAPPAPPEAAATVGPVARVAEPLAGRVEFWLLGPTRMTVNGAEVAIRGGRLRQLLGLLLVHRGEVVGVDRLVEELWEGNPPDSASAALRVHVSRLRKLLAAANCEELLATRPSGYRIDLAGELLDVERFELLAARGHARLAAGAAEEAAELLRDALALWKGDALADLPLHPAVTAEASRLAELRLVATEDSIDAELACGRHRQILGDLEALVAAHPLRERLWAQRMTALYRSGRQADALASYQVLRRQLADELGLEPSHRLAELHHAILNHAEQSVY
jgi:DNA-binding response OmpR family regulator